MEIIMSSSCQVSKSDLLKFLIDNEIKLTVKDDLIYIDGKDIAIDYKEFSEIKHIAGKPNSQQYKKYIHFESVGIRLITLYEDEWKYKTDIVKIKLLNIIGVDTSDKIYARNCSIESVSLNDRKSFYNSYHIQGCKWGGGSVNLGLYHNDDLVAAMSFCEKSSKIYELTRYATKCIVCGGFSKLLSYFKNNNDWEEIFTFSDNRWHTSATYDTQGFVKDKMIRADYEYIIDGKRSHKFNFRLKCIKKKYPDLFNPNESELQNMDRIGIPRIYDCGKFKYIMRKINVTEI